MTYLRAMGPQRRESHQHSLLDRVQLQRRCMAVVWRRLLLRNWYPFSDDALQSDNPLHARELLQSEFEIGAGVGGGHLRANAGLTLWYDRV